MHGTEKRLKTCFFLQKNVPFFETQEGVLPVAKSEEENWKKGKTLCYYTRCNLMHGLWYQDPSSLILFVLKYFYSNWCDVDDISEK